MNAAESTMTGAAVPAPTLRFQLMGEWNQLDLRSDEALTASIHRYVESALGREDAEAQARGLLRKHLHESLTTAREASAASMFIASEIAPGAPMPVTLTIYNPTKLRMSPAVGTGASTVADLLQSSLAQLGIEGIEDAVRLSIEGSEILRLSHFQTDPIHEQTPDDLLRKLVVDYWYTVPGTKQVVLANFVTPLADIPHVMLAFFDAIVGASRFDSAPAEAAESA